MSKKRKSAAPSRSGKRSADNGYKDIDKYINSVLDFIKFVLPKEIYAFFLWIGEKISLKLRLQILRIGEKISLRLGDAKFYKL